MMTTLPNRLSALFADPLHSMIRELDSGSPWHANGTSGLLRQVAPLSMWEDGDRIHIQLDVPGFEASNLDVSVHKGQLTIKGERKIGDQPPTYLHQERFFGSFERSVALAEWVDPSNIEATLRDGVLHLTLSKKPEAKCQRVAINCNGSDAKRIESDGT
jgi:HSP20 family molecular chaperone IbpA